MKQGALIFDERSDRYDIRFDLADYYGLARQVLCFPRGFHICAESFKAGAIFNFRHITSPIYIV